MEVFIVTGYNSYTCDDGMDEQSILGVFHSLEKAERYGTNYLKDDTRDFEKIDIDQWIVQ